MKISILLLVLISVGQCKDCLDSNGNNVDYWFILKLPSNADFLLSGWEYLYCDSKDSCKNLIQMTDKLGDDSSPLQKTIAQIQFDKDDELSILWNDQPYGSKAQSNRAHSKGMMTASSKTSDGFVINHSLPNFPRLEGKKIKLGVPQTGPHYAQHFFCVSLGIGEIEKIAKQYKISEIIINLANFPTSFDSYPNIKSLKDTNQISDKQGEVSIKSKGDLPIVVFSVQQGVKAPKKKVTKAPPKDDKMLSKKRLNSDDLSELEDMKSPKKKKTEVKKQIFTVNKQHKSKESIFLQMFNMIKMQGSSDTESLPSNPEKASASSSSSSSESSEEENQLMNQGFFSDVVALGLESNVAMSTWGKGKPKLQHPVCTKYKSLSVLFREHQITVGDNKKDFEFSFKKDHSKIGITFGNTKKWVIVADLNRQVLQTSRGGTAICFWNENLWKILDQSFKKRQKCN